MYTISVAVVTTTSGAGKGGFNLLRTPPLSHKRTTTKTTGRVHARTHIYTQACGCSQALTIISHDPLPCWGLLLPTPVCQATPTGGGDHTPRDVSVLLFLHGEAPGGGGSRGDGIAMTTPISLIHFAIACNRILNTWRGKIMLITPISQQKRPVNSI